MKKRCFSYGLPQAGKSSVGLPFLGWVPRASRSVKDFSSNYSLLWFMRCETITHSPAKICKKQLLGYPLRFQSLCLEEGRNGRPQEQWPRMCWELIDQPMACYLNHKPRMSARSPMTNHVDSNKWIRASRFPQEILSQLRDAIASSGHFPPLKDISFTHQWGGPVSVPLDMAPAMGYATSMRS